MHNREHKHLLTIGIPIYNGAGFVEETIKSILSQDFDDYELLFVDDGCTDNSVDIIKSFDDKRIHIFENGYNYGCGFGNCVIYNQAASKYTLLLACDDLLAENSLSRRIQFMEDNKEISILAGNLELFNHDNPQQKNISRFSGPCHQIILAMYISLAASIIRNDFLDMTGLSFNLFNRESVSDYEFLAKCSFEKGNYPFQPHHLDEICVHFRMRANSLGMKDYHSIHSRPDDLMVYYYMCQKLGMQPTMQELRAHQSLRDHKVLGKYLNNDLNFVKKWCEKLIQQHRKYRVFSCDDFDSFITNRFGALNLKQGIHDFIFFDRRYTIKK